MVEVVFEQYGGWFGARNLKSYLVGLAVLLVVIRSVVSI